MCPLSGTKIKKREGMQLKKQKDKNDRRWNQIVGKPGTLRMTVKNVCPECSRSALYAVSQNWRPKQNLLVLPGTKNPYIKTTLVIRNGVQAATASLKFVYLASKLSMYGERTQERAALAWLLATQPQWRACSQVKVRLVKQITTKP